MEKERYETTYDGIIYDIYDNEIKQYISKPTLPIKRHYEIVCDLLNQQDAKIKELKEENKRLFNLTQISSCENCEKVTIKTNQMLTEENQQLKQSQKQKSIDTLTYLLRLFQSSEKNFFTKQYVCRIINHIKDIQE